MNMNLNKSNLIQFVLGDSLTTVEEVVNDESIQMVYIDPPFFKQSVLEQYNKKKDKIISFSDKWASLDEYCEFIYKILSISKNKMNDSALIFVHCDTSANHHIRVQLDKVFKPENFVNEIIWTYKRWSNSSKKLLDAHQTIWVYSKSTNYKFHRIFTEYSPTTNVDQILQLRARNKNGQVIYKRDEDNEILGVDSKEGVPLRDVWEIPFLNPKAKERVGYPTQKPVELLNRIIAISTDKDDLILDPFSGCGSMGIAALENSRKYIGFDNNTHAIEISNKRLSEYFLSPSAVIDGKYDNFSNLENEIRDFISEIGAIPVERNNGIDGLFNSQNGLVAIRFQRPHETIDDATNAIKKGINGKPVVQSVIIKTHDEGLFESKSNDVIIIESLRYKFIKTINS